MNHLTQPTLSPDFKSYGMKDCPNGCSKDMMPQSNCCGANIDTDTLICLECHEHSDIEVCELCDNTGEVEMTEEEHDDYIESKREDLRD